jgi:uncharacterized membrane protein
MKRFLTATLLAAIGSIGPIGCGSGSPGGPGVSNKEKSNTHISTEDQTFTLSVPSIQNRIKQGETNQYTIGISRGKNFDQDVKLKLDGLPKGVTADPSEPMIKHSDKEVKIALKAANDAAIGEFTIKVTGHPSTGADATNQFTLHVDKK